VTIPAPADNLVPSPKSQVKLLLENGLEAGPVLVLLNSKVNLSQGGILFETNE
jgi:hypothetical protein